MKKQIWVILIVLAISSLACSITLPFDWNSGGIGETQSMDIAENYEGDTEFVSLTIEMGGGELLIEGGAGRLVEGTVRYNVDKWAPEVEWEGNALLISQDVSSLPIQPNMDIENVWDLRLGDEQPIALTIGAGAYDGTLDLSGIPITNLEIRDGASNAEVYFRAPNPVRMAAFSYHTGASDVDIIGLGNANTDVFTFDGGAGKAVLDFSGTLEQNMRVEINGGVGDIQIIVPEGTQAVLTVDGELLDVNNDGWEESGDVYSVAGEGPRIEIEVNMSVGSLELDIE